MPTKYNLVYLAPAAEDLEEIVKYHLVNAGVESGRAIYQTIKTEIATLMRFSLAGQLHPDPMLAAQNYRKLVLTKTYVAIYKVIDETVYIYRIVNGKTDYSKLLY